MPERPAPVTPQSCLASAGGGPGLGEHSPHDGQPGDGEHEGRFIVVNHVLGQVPEVQGPGRGTESKKVRRVRPARPHPWRPGHPHVRLCSADGQEGGTGHGQPSGTHGATAGNLCSGSRRRGGWSLPFPTVLPPETGQRMLGGEGRLRGPPPRGSDGLQQTKRGRNKCGTNTLP